MTVFASDSDSVINPRKNEVIIISSTMMVTNKKQFVKSGSNVSLVVSVSYSEVFCQNSRSAHKLLWNISSSWNTVKCKSRIEGERVEMVLRGLV